MKILQKLGFGLFGVIVALGLSACGEEKNKSLESTDSSKMPLLVVGATPVPASEILEFAKPLLAQKGVEMKVQVFTDYTTPDIALNDGSNDANLYQHKPFMEAQNAQRGFNLVALEPIYVVPLGFYSKKYKSVDEIPEGADIALPGDSSNLARALILLHDFGVIELKDPKNLASTIEYDIVKNPKNLRFRPVEAAGLPSLLPNVDAAVINANYALQAGFSIKSAFFHEDSKSEYVNVFVTRKELENDERIQKLKEVLMSDEIAEFILQKYKGEILPVNLKVKI